MQIIREVLDRLVNGVFMTFLIFFHLNFAECSLTENLLSLKTQILLSIQFTKSIETELDHYEIIDRPQVAVIAHDLTN